MPLSKALFSRKNEWVSPSRTVHTQPAYDVLFSGSLYLLALTGWVFLAFATPVGGIAFVAGWITLAAAGLKLETP